MCIFRISFVHAGGWGGTCIIQNMFQLTALMLAEHFAEHFHVTFIYSWTLSLTNWLHNMGWPFMSTVCDEKYRHVKYFMSLHPLKNTFKRSKSGSWPCQTFLVDDKGDPSALWQRPSADLISHDPINTANKLSQLCWCRPISNLCHLMDDVRERQYTNRKPLPQIKSCMMHLTGGVMTKMIWQRSHGVVLWRMQTTNV